MMRLLARARSLGRMVAQGEVDLAWRKLRYQLYAERVSYGLIRDLRAPVTPPRVRWPVTVRPLVGDDVSALFDPDDPLLSDAMRRELRERLRLLEVGIGRPFVAVNPAGVPCFVQWLFPAAENAALERYYDRVFPHLADDEALIDGAYTVPRFRGLGVMPAAMVQIAERATAFGATRVLSFTFHDNAVSLRASEQAGFVPFVIRSERWRLLRRHVRFLPVTEVARGSQASARRAT
jgi:GNAT superfamily N-acetyltransferase